MQPLLYSTAQLCCICVMSVNIKLSKHIVVIWISAFANINLMYFLMRNHLIWLLVAGIPKTGINPDTLVKSSFTCCCCKMFSTVFKKLGHQRRLTVHAIPARHQNFSIGRLKSRTHQSSHHGTRIQTVTQHSPLSNHILILSPSRLMHLIRGLNVLYQPLTSTADRHTLTHWNVSRKWVTMRDNILHFQPVQTSTHTGLN